MFWMQKLITDWMRSDMNKGIEKIQDKFFIYLTFVIFCIVDLYIMIKENIIIHIKERKKK